MVATLVRNSAFAGRFYPGSAQEIRNTLEALRSQAGDHHRAKHPPILILPHAGWIYSGLAAIRGIATLVDSPPKRIVLIGPSHHAYFPGFSIGAYEKYRTPLGDLPGDLDLYREISEKTGFKFVEEAHAGEHSVEVMLPMLQFMLPPDIKVLAIQGGSVTHADVDKLADALAASLNPSTDTLIVSTDLSHFYSYNEARELDAHTIVYIVTGNDTALIEQSGEGGRLCCGFTGVLVAINLAKKWKLAKPELLMYYNSGDSGGDKEGVVGYASIAWPSPDLSLD